MKPIVGIMPLWDDEKNSIWMLPGYMDGILQAGGTPVIFPFSDEEEEIFRLTGLCDGFLFTGGHDVSPKLYQEEPLEGLVSVCKKRDELERMVLGNALALDKPVLGICRGIQFINVALGGDLYQDIPLLHPSEVEHHQSAPYDIPVHEVSLSPGTPLRKLLGVETLPVNSYHHQAVRTVASSLKRMAVSPDGLVEAVYKEDQKFLWAVQWHPEFSYKTDAHSRKIFQAFVDAMK